MNMQQLFAQRIGGEQFGLSNEIYKFFHHKFQRIPENQLIGTFSLTTFNAKTTVKIITYFCCHFAYAGQSDHIPPE